jgi:4,5-dihydroxyphthalate decarboxylase
VVRRRLLEQNPWIALNLYKMFTTAKDMAVQQMTTSLEPYFATGAVSAATRTQSGTDTLGHGIRAVIDADPLAYGIKASRKVLETITQYNVEQGLTKERVKLEDMFWPSTLEL